MMNLNESEVSETIKNYFFIGIFENLIYFHNLHNQKLSKEQMANITRIFDFPYHQLEAYNLKKAFSTKYNGVWKSTSIQEFIDQANAISRGLLRLGIKPNDKIAVISSTNRTEWNILDIGVLQTGAQNVPIYPTIASDEYEYILNHSESIYCFVSDVEVLKKLNAIKGKTNLIVINVSHL